MLQNFQYNNGIKANKILPRIFSSFGAVWPDVRNFANLANVWQYFEG